MSNIFIIIAEAKNGHRWVVGVGTYNVNLFLSLQEANEALIDAEEEAKNLDSEDIPCFKIHSVKKESV